MNLFDQLRNIENAEFVDMSLVGKYSKKHSDLAGIPMLILAYEEHSNKYGEHLIADCIVGDVETPEEAEISKVLIGGQVLVDTLKSPAVRLPQIIMFTKVKNQSGGQDYYAFQQVSKEEEEFIRASAAYVRDNLPED